MILRPRPHWFRMLFVWHGSVLPNILPRLTLVFIIGAAAVPIHKVLSDHMRFAPGIQPFTLIGISLAIFLGFRNSAGYERYWEARKLWGNLLNHSRSLTRLWLTLVVGGEREGSAFVLGLMAFAQALRHQLRGTDGQVDLRRLLPDDAYARTVAARYRPAIVLLWLGEQLQHARQAGEISDMLVQPFEVHLAGMADVLGGCERIAGTPIPLTYSVMLHRTIYLFCMLLPFGLVDAIGWLTPPFAAFVSYTFLALDAIGEEIEDPFGTEPNDLPLDAMSRTIEDSLGEMLGEQLPPPEPVPANYIVL